MCVQNQKQTAVIPVTLVLAFREGPPAKIIAEMSGYPWLAGEGVNTIAVLKLSVVYRVHAHGQRLHPTHRCVQPASGFGRGVDTLSSISYSGARRRPQSSDRKNKRSVVLTNPTQGKGWPACRPDTS